MNVDKIDIQKIRQLYTKQGLSAREIGEQLGHTTWQVIRVMKKHGITRRTPQETQRLKFDKKPLSFNKKTSLSSKERALHQAGLLLYWAEGVKAINHVVDFSNSDEKMIIIFLTFLRNIYQINEKRLRVLVYCYANQNAQNLIAYWSKHLSIPDAQFTKPYIRKDFDATKTHKMPHGLVHIRYNDKKLFMQILHDLAIISDRLIKRWDGGVVKRTCL